MWLRAVQRLKLKVSERWMSGFVSLSKNILRDVFSWSIVIQNECVQRFSWIDHHSRPHLHFNLKINSWQAGMVVFCTSRVQPCRLFDLQLLLGNARIAYFHLHFNPLNLIPCQSCKKASLHCTIMVHSKYSVLIYTFSLNVHITWGKVDLSICLDQKEQLLKLKWWLKAFNPDFFNFLAHILHNPAKHNL